MESWREYVEEVEAESKFQLILENIENAKNEKDVDVIVESWIREQEQLLTEIDISAKVNDFFLNLSFKAIQMVGKMKGAMAKHTPTILKILEFISSNIKKFSAKHPLLAATAFRFFVLLTMAVVADMVGPSVDLGLGEPAGVEQGLTQEEINFFNAVKGFIADGAGDINQHLDGADVHDKPLYGESKKLAQEAINILSNIESNPDKFAKAMEDGGEAADLINKYSTEFDEVFSREPGDRPLEQNTINQLEKWRRVGEKIQSITK